VLRAACERDYNFSPVPVRGTSSPFSPAALFSLSLSLSLSLALSSFFSSRSRD